jgi:hypothetical protein
LSLSFLSDKEFNIYKLKSLFINDSHILSLERSLLRYHLVLQLSLLCLLTINLLLFLLLRLLLILLLLTLLLDPLLLILFKNYSLHPFPRPDVLLCLLTPGHPLNEALIIKLLNLLLSLQLLQPVYFVDVYHQGIDYLGGLHVLSEEATRTNRLSTAGTLFLYLTIVIFYAVAAELVQTLTHIQRVLVQVIAHWT